MEHTLTKKEYLTIASMLFGLFFGAGNLIFPIYMGQMAGRNIIPAAAGFLITGVGLPLLGIIAMGISRSNGLSDMADHVSHWYSIAFTSVLYLTIGPFFAIPRTATVPFAVGIEPLAGNQARMQALLAIFSFLFFAAVLFFSLRPSKILVWVGKILNPLFLVLLGILVIAAFIHPMGKISSIEPSEAYAHGSFFKGFMEGYNTMDALASLAFGIVIINVIRNLGVEKPEHIAADTVKSGILSMTLMAAIYIAIIITGAQSRGITGVCSNGGTAFSVVADHYFGKTGAILLALIITFACLKTAIGLITSCSETFVSMTNGRFSYRACAVTFVVISFATANLGLSRIIEYSIPVLMLLYPLVITLILLSIFGKSFGYSPAIYRPVTFFTFCAALIDFVNALPVNLQHTLHTGYAVSFAKDYLPLFSIGLGWILPAVAGLMFGIIAYRFTRRSR